MTDTYTFCEPMRVVDVVSDYHNMWYVRVVGSDFLYLSKKQKVCDCLADDTVMDDLYFPSRHAAYACCAGYNVNNVPVETVTGDTMESQVMEF